MSAQKQKKDKQKVLDEVWTEERVRSFLMLEPPEHTNADFHRLLKAYQSMRVENFIEFIEYFKEAGGDLQSTNADGKTLKEVISVHEKARPYLEALN